MVSKLLLQFEGRAMADHLVYTVSPMERECPFLCSRDKIVQLKSFLETNQPISGGTPWEKKSFSEGGNPVVSGRAGMTRMQSTQ